MTAVAFTLVLAAAVIHPTWNALAKRAVGGDTIAFVWLTSAISSALYVPIVVTLVAVTHVRLPNPRLDLVMMAGTGIIHQIYFLLLQRGYRVGSFSIVYPVARGSGPLITSLFAVSLFGERLAPVQLLGIGIIIVAIFVISGVSARKATDGSPMLRRSVRAGLFTGVSIAAYTLWDKQSVSAFAIAPILYDFGRTVTQTLVSAPIVFGSSDRRAALASTSQRFGREVVGVAVLSPLAYLLILYALTTAPVSLVAPLRESSIVIGAFIGAHVFAEGQLRRRLIAAALMLVGIAALARG